MGGEGAVLVALILVFLGLLAGLFLLIWIVRIRGRRRTVRENALQQAKARQLGGRQLRRGSHPPVPRRRLNPSPDSTPPDAPRC